MKDTKNHRITVEITQGDRFGSASEVLLPLRLEVAQHVGAQGAFAIIGTCRLVVGNALAWNQKGGHGINQRRFSGADISLRSPFFPPSLSVQTRPSKVPQLNISSRCRRKPARRSSATNPISSASLIIFLHSFYRSLQGICQGVYLFCWLFHIFSIEHW